MSVDCLADDLKVGAVQLPQLLLIILIAFSRLLLLLLSDIHLTYLFACL